jgi:uncharacterized protein
MTARVAVMAKAPVAGAVKTRLMPALGADGAARLAQRMLDHALDQARGAVLGEVVLACAPDTSHPAFVRQAERGGVRLVAQGEGDLGARMLRLFAPGESVLLIGTDAPAIDAGVLRRAAAALADADAVFVPTADGGYALIGLRGPQPVLFDNMPWSTARVMALTRERLARAGLRHVELPTIHDIDEPADLAHLPAGWV